MNHAEGEIRDLEDSSGGEPNSHGDHGSAGVGELGLRSEDLVKTSLVVGVLQTCSHLGRDRGLEDGNATAVIGALIEHGGQGGVDGEQGPEDDLDGVGSELIDEIAVEGLHETEGEGNLGHAAVDLLGELGECTVTRRVNERSCARSSCSTLDAMMLALKRCCILTFKHAAQLDHLQVSLPPFSLSLSLMTLSPP